MHLGFILGSWGDLGAIFGDLGAILGPSWVILILTWGILGPTWGACGPKVAFALVFTRFLLVFVVPNNTDDPGLSPACPRLDPLWGLGKSDVFHKKMHGA